MMTYEELLKAWRAEREAEGLAKLPEDFYERVAELISALRASLKMADTRALRTRLTQAELENVLKMVEDIFWWRLDKALRALRAGQPLDTADLTPEERALLGPLEAALTSARKFLEGLLRGELKQPTPSAQAATAAEAPASEGVAPSGEGRAGLMLVRILADVPALVGADMKIHGPFKRGDVAFIPAENALGLIRKGLAVEVELREGA